MNIQYSEFGDTGNKDQTINQAGGDIKGQGNILERLSVRSIIFGKILRI